MASGEPSGRGPAIAGDYVLESRLGSGGMGVVHLGRSASGRQVAVKVVHEQFAADPEFRARFRQEVAAARRVSGAFTAPVVDADPEAGRPWMATLYVPGLTLSEKVKKDGPFGADELWQLAAGLAEALRDIHRAGVVHRDLKPSNVLLAEDGPKVIDFGISRPFDSDLRTETGKVIGTPPFMAPEQFRSPRAVGPAADVFALGCLLVHAARGRGPFDADSPYLVAYQVVHDDPDLSEVPEVLRPLVAGCLAKDPEDRPAPDGLMAALRETRASVTGQAGTGHPAGPAASTAAAAGPPGAVPPATGAGASPSRPSARRRRGLRPVLFAVVAALLVAGGTALGVQQLRAGETEAVRPLQVDTSARRPGAAPAWEREIAADDGAWDRQALAPRCGIDGTGSRLYCAGGGVSAESLDARTGEVLWTREAAWADRWAGAPYVSGGLVLVAEPGKRLQGLDPESGTPVWTARIDGYDGCCVYAGGSVLVATDGGVVSALDGRTGEVRWTRRVPGHPNPVMSYADGTMIVFSVSADGSQTQVSAVRPENGRTDWSRRLPGDLLPVGMDDGTLVLTRTGRGSTDVDAIVRYDPRTRAATRTPLPYAVAAPRTVVDGGTVYLLVENGGLLAVDTRARKQDKALLWELRTGVNGPSSPALSDGRLYFSAGDGRLLVVDTAAGRLVAQTPPRFDPGRGGAIQDQPAPIVAGGRVYGATPRGSVFSVPLDELRITGRHG